MGKSGVPAKTRQTQPAEAKPTNDIPNLKVVSMPRVGGIGDTTLVWGYWRWFSPSRALEKRDAEKRHSILILKSERWLLIVCMFRIAFARSQYLETMVPVRAISQFSFTDAIWRCCQLSSSGTVRICLPFDIKYPHRSIIITFDGYVLRNVWETRW